MAKVYPWVYFDDNVVASKNATLSVASSAVLYGLSVYTVFPVHIQSNGKKLAFRLEDHFTRLLNSAKIIGLSTFEENWSYEKFKNAMSELLAKNTLNGDVFIRATVHVDAEIAGTRSRGLSTVLSAFVYDAERILHPDGVRVKTSVWRRIPDYAIPSRAKVNGAYVNSVLAKQDALDSGYDDCIFLDVDGHVCELSAANIFIIRGGMLITPSETNDLLEGITRRTILEIASQSMNLKCVERAIDLTELYIADEVFASGTSAYIAPIVEIDGRRIGTGKPGKVSKKLQKHHQEVLTGKICNNVSYVVEL